MTSYDFKVIVGIIIVVALITLGYTIYLFFTKQLFDKPREKDEDRFNVSVNNGWIKDDKD